MAIVDPPLSTMIDRAAAPAWPLPPALAEWYGGPLGFPAPAGRPHVIANFVSTLDGVVSYAIPGRSGGGPISGNNVPDRFVMGLLRACADAVVVGAGTVRSMRRDHAVTPGYIFPPATDEYAALRRALGKPPQPMTVIVTARGDLDLDAAAVRARDVPVLIVTTDAGAARLAQAGALPAAVAVHAAGPGPEVPAAAILAALGEVSPASLVLTEGGPLLMGTFLAGGALDELFLTVAPQIAGRAGDSIRPAFVEGLAFTPERAPWGRLLSAKSAGDHLYLRYAL
jgi:riboflavin biosynthesis pyrimidine reductase